MAYAFNFLENLFDVQRITQLISQRKPGVCIGLDCIQILLLQHGLSCYGIGMYIEHAELNQLALPISETAVRVSAGVQVQPESFTNGQHAVRL